MTFLQGKKTYVISVLLVMYAVGGYFTGHLNLQQAIEPFGIGAIGAFLRMAITTP